MRGSASVLFVAAALAATGCASSARTGRAVDRSDGGPGCYELTLGEISVIEPDCLSYRETAGGPSMIVFEYDGAGEDGVGVEVASRNRINVDFWVAEGRYDIEYRLADHLRARDEYARLAYLSEFSPVREQRFGERMAHTYSFSHPYTFEDGRLMRGRYALFPVAGGRLYAAVTGVWEATRHEDMNGAFNTIVSSLEVETPIIKRIPCRQPEEEPGVDRQGL